MPLAPEQVDTALAVLAEMVAGLYREKIAHGEMEPQEYRDLLTTALGDRNMNASVFAGPLKPLYRLAPLR